MYISLVLSADRLHCLFSKECTRPQDQKQKAGRCICKIPLLVLVVLSNLSSRTPLSRWGGKCNAHKVCSLCVVVGDIIRVMKAHADLRYRGMSVSRSVREQSEQRHHVFALSSSGTRASWCPGVTAATAFLNTHCGNARLQHLLLHAATIFVCGKLFLLLAVFQSSICAQMDVSYLHTCNATDLAAVILLFIVGEMIVISCS